MRTNTHAAIAAPLPEFFENEEPVLDARLDFAIDQAAAALNAKQKPDGHWVFELEADATIPAEYILLGHYMDEIDQPLYERMAVYLRRIQGQHGGWPLFHDGAFNLSASVKAYFALKAVGDSADLPHMQRARAAILAHGGAERCNVFTRIQLALFGEVPWRAVPVMPIEIMGLPAWFPFHLDKVSYWSRTVMVPLLVLIDRHPHARNPRDVHIQELFTQPPETIRHYIRGPYRSRWGHIFGTVDRILRGVTPLFPKTHHRNCITRAVEFVTERLNGEDGLGGIYPAMANSVMMFDCLGYGPDHPHMVTAKQALKKLVIDGPDEAYCQPCLSPIWDTGLAGQALVETGGPNLKRVRRSCDWLATKQVTELYGDWSVNRPGVRPGGWAFQYENAHYPDVDDTAVVAMLLDRTDRAAYSEQIERAEEWILGVQSRNGGWGAFDADNVHHYLNHIPFADHGALLDPPTADVTARCVSFLAQRGHTKDEPAVQAALAYLKRDQEPDGSWYGRWGTNYIYGTWSVLCALNAIGVPHDSPEVLKAADWLVSKQRSDGGWGEDNESYDQAPHGEYKQSNPSQTAWALLGLMAVGQTEHPAVRKGIDYLAATQKSNGEWDEEPYTAVGFAKVFYLRYHGYRLFFPLMAMARFRNLQLSNSKAVAYGM